MSPPASMSPTINGVPNDFREVFNKAWDHLTASPFFLEDDETPVLSFSTRDKSDWGHPLWSRQDLQGLNGIKKQYPLWLISTAFKFLHSASFNKLDLCNSYYLPFYIIAENTLQMDPKKVSSLSHDPYMSQENMRSGFWGLQTSIGSSSKALWQHPWPL